MHMHQNKQAVMVPKHKLREQLGAAGSLFGPHIVKKKLTLNWRYENENEYIYLIATQLYSVIFGTNKQNGPEKTLELLRVNVIALTSSDETLNSPHAAVTEASASRKSCKHVWNRRWGRQVPATERLSRPFRNTRSGH